MTDTSADAAEKLADWFGDRCTGYDPECATCRAWEAFDALSRDLEAMRARAEQAEAERDAALKCVALEATARAMAEAQLAELTEWDAANRIEQLVDRVAELESERVEIGKASLAMVDELIAYLCQNASAYKEALAGMKAARAVLSQEGRE